MTDTRLLWQNYLQPASLPKALALLREHPGRARLVAGGTDLLVELSRGIRPTETVIDLTAIRELRYVREAEGLICLGALATHNDVLASAACAARALPLTQACREVGAPQIRTRATVAGNLVTASPANDTITPLVALGASLLLASAGGERVVPSRDFYQGVRRTVLAPDELVREIRVPALRPDQRGLFLKLGLRRAQAIAVVNVALVLTFADGPQRPVTAAAIALGCVAPTVVRAEAAEAFLRGRRLDAATRAEAGRLALDAIAPIDDLRGSAMYRRATIAALVTDGLARIAAGDEAAGPPSGPVLLDTGGIAAPSPPFTGTIVTTINGRRYDLPNAADKTLLDLLRDDAGLTGTKEGCAEGECGACTVWLAGQAVMACLIPAPQAHGAPLTTIEGLAAIASASPVSNPDMLAERPLHPLQQAFIAAGAVQCGYCIPGMLMAGAKLLEEHPHPNLDQIRVALSGNICRCTGYRTILDAVSNAASGGWSMESSETGAAGTDDSGDRT